MKSLSYFICKCNSTRLSKRMLIENQFKLRILHILSTFSGSEYLSIMSCGFQLNTCSMISLHWSAMLNLTYTKCSSCVNLAL